MKELFSNWAEQRAYNSKADVEDRLYTIYKDNISCSFSQEQRKEMTTLRINNPISNIFTGRLALSDNSEYLSLLGSEIASNRITLLNARKLSLL